MTIINKKAFTAALEEDGRLRLSFLRAELGAVMVHLCVDQARELFDKLSDEYVTRQTNVNCLDGLIRVRFDLGSGVLRRWHLEVRTRPPRAPIGTFFDDPIDRIYIILSEVGHAELSMMLEAYVSVMERYAYPNGELCCEGEARREFDGFMSLAAL